MPPLTWSQFDAVDIRTGTITHAEVFSEARVPAYKLTIDFGSQLGTKRSSAQITDLYTPAELIGRQIIAVVNFPPKQIGPFMSECLVLGVTDNDRGVVLLGTQTDTPNGLRIG